MKKEIMLSVIQKRWVMLCLFAMLCVFGYYSWKQLSIEAYPDIADVTSQVVTQVPGLAAEEVDSRLPYHWNVPLTACPVCMLCAVKALSDYP